MSEHFTDATPVTDGTMTLLVVVLGVAILAVSGWGVYWVRRLTIAIESGKPK